MVVHVALLGRNLGSIVVRRVVDPVRPETRMTLCHLAYYWISRSIRSILASHDPPPSLEHLLQDVISVYCKRMHILCTDVVYYLLSNYSKIY